MGKKHLKIQQHNHESSMIIFPDGTSIIQNDKEIDKFVKKWTKLQQDIAYVSTLEQQKVEQSGVKWRIQSIE